MLQWHPVKQKSRRWNIIPKQFTMTNENTPNQESNPPGGQIILYSEGQTNINVRIEGETVWLTQKHMSELYQVSVPTINHHLSGIYEEGELSPDRTIRKYLIVQLEG
ncbi:MAG: hypothetical protein FWE67_08845, partial [Planctomycetaceae bacterium]|nr:hypothetical protein [Planctomycetaceae bacterium]